MVAGGAHAAANPVGATGSTNRKPDRMGDSVEYFIHPWYAGRVRSGYIPPDVRSFTLTLTLSLTLILSLSRVRVRARDSGSDQRQ